MGRDERMKEKTSTTREIETKIMQLFRMEKRCMPIVPSLILPHGWEADIAAVTKTEMIHEIEIKVSRSDFLADFRKQQRIYTTADAIHNKHEAMKNRMHGKDMPVSGWALGKGLSWKFWTPNYFSFASPIGVLKIEDIPEYAGWYEVENIYRPKGEWRSVESWETVCHERKTPPRLHKEKVFSESMKTAFLKRLTNVVAFGRGNISEEANG